MNQIHLSPKQEKIVSFGEGAILVKASAGSGKTRVLTERIKRLLLKTRRNILAITFTNKAGEEMKDRLGQIPDLNNRLFIGTFHGFCQQVLENHGKHIGFDSTPHIFENEFDRLELVEQAIEKTPSYYRLYEKKSYKEKRATCRRALEFISKVKRKLLSENELLINLQDEDMVLLYKTYQDILISQNAMDFDDLILYTYNLFIQNGKIASLYRRTYEYICVDEAQDLNFAQYQLLRSLTGNEHKNVMMVGDPNQSIFAFNGSSPKYMTDMFLKDYHPHIIELKENYRSSRCVLEAASKIIPDSCNAVNAAIKGIFEINEFDDEQSEAAWIADKIEELIMMNSHEDIEGEIAYEKIAVLGRTKYVFNDLDSILEERDIPYYYKVTPGSINFESDSMKAFDMAIRIKLNPLDNLHWRKLEDLLEIKNSKSLGNMPDLVKKQAHKLLIDIVIELDEGGRNFRFLFENFKSTISKNGIIEDENERKMVIDDVNELLKHWHTYRKGTDQISLLQFKNSMALGKTHPLYQEKGVTLSTVHTLKGQEYDIIFLMGMDDETFPDYRAIRSGGLEMVQEKNNAYVAFTRSKRFLYVTWPKLRYMPWGGYKNRKRSRFLKDF